MMKKNCKRCGASFEGNSRNRYCSETCSALAVIERRHDRRRVDIKPIVKLMPSRERNLGSAEWTRDKSYDDGFGEKLQSVYSPLSIIAIVRDVAECQSCHCVKPLINGYCEPCITLGANERQVMRPAEIQARSRAGRENSVNSPWRFGIGRR